MAGIMAQVEGVFGASELGAELHAEANSPTIVVAAITIRRTCRNRCTQLASVVASGFLKASGVPERRDSEKLPFEEATHEWPDGTESG